MFVKEAVWKYRSYRQLYYFALKQRRMEFQIPDQAMLEEETMPIFYRMLEKSSRYLEYGSGGSTVQAAKLNKPFISVDTDRYFLKAVQRKIEFLAPDQNLVHADIGWTKAYGYPAFESPKARSVKKWRSYSELPWRYVENGQLPDLVMIDGRFRVAAALTSCLHLVNAPESRVLVDDYAERPFYHVIEAYAQLVEMAGRMAIFRPLPAASPAIVEAIERYALDWR